MFTYKKSLSSSLLGGALLAGALLMAAPAGMALAAPTDGVNDRPDTSFPQPGVNAIQTAGDKVFDGTKTIPGFLGGGPISVDTTGAGALYHGLYGYSKDAADNLGEDGPGKAQQGLTVGVLNTFGTNYKVRCNIVVQTRCGGPV